MKRTYSEITPTLSELPQTLVQDPRAFKSKLDGRYTLKVLNAIDISKPKDKQAEVIDEPEEEEVAVMNRLNKSNARMIQLDLVDANESPIKAIETERIDMLNEIKVGQLVEIAGPVDIRCGNIMLEKRHVLKVSNI